MCPTWECVHVVPPGVPPSTRPPTFNHKWLYYVHRECLQLRALRGNSVLCLSSEVVTHWSELNIMCPLPASLTLTWFLCLSGSLCILSDFLNRRFWWRAGFHTASLCVLCCSCLHSCVSCAPRIRQEQFVFPARVASYCSHKQTVKCCCHLFNVNSGSKCRELHYKCWGVNLKRALVCIFMCWGRG